MKFQLTPTQTERFIKWRDKQAMLGRPLPGVKYGSRFEFRFTPGTSCKVIDTLTKDELDLTDDEVSVYGFVATTPH